jgi:hypothetical protein
MPNKSKLSKAGTAHSTDRRPPAKKGTPTTKSRTDQFVEAASRYASANSASKEIARAKLQELGIIDASGKLTKTYK